MEINIPALFAITLLVQALATGCSTQSGTTAKPSAEPRQPKSSEIGNGDAFAASVRSGLGQFYFPIENIDRQWEWQASPANILEYSWIVVVPLDDGVYKFGFNRFCFQPRAKSVGTFEQLLATGQVNIWKENPDGSFSVQEDLRGVKAKRHGNGLLVELIEPRLLEKFLARRPAIVHFTTGYALYPQKDQEVKVVYD
jgi:hypothetical protein